MNRNYFNAILTALMLTLSLSSAFADERAGDIVSVRGNVFVERARDIIKAEPKLGLREADSVATEEQSRAKLLFRDDSILTLGPKSRLVVKQYLYSPENKRAESVYELLDGKLRAVVGSPGFTVKTPTAFAAARGTIFLIWFDSATNSTGIAVIEGEVVVKNINAAIGGEVRLGPGQVSTVAKDGSPVEPRPFAGTPGEIKKADADSKDGGALAESETIRIIQEVRVEGTPVLTLPDFKMESFKPSGLVVERLPFVPKTPPINETPGVIGKTPVTINLNFHEPQTNVKVNFPDSR
jgi:hypothetical protein